MSETALTFAADKTSARDALLKAAQLLFAEKGYAQVSTRELAEAAGVNLGAIQYHFGSKPKLFIAAVHCMLEDCSCLRARLLEFKPGGSPLDAAKRLCDFIEGLLTYILRPTGPQATRVMSREVLSRSSETAELFDELVDSVVNEFSRPTHDALAAVLSVLAPHIGDAERSHVIASIVGQCTFYVTHRPFVEKIRGVDLGEEQAFRSLLEHILCFTLRGLRCEEALVLEVLNERREREL